MTLDAYVDDPEIRRRAWRSRRDHPAWTARPNAGHAALVTLQHAGQLRSIITQNIDGLHHQAGSDPDLVIEVHGSIFGVVCLSCGDRTTMVRALARVDAGEPDPSCVDCGGILKSATIAFGQSLDPDVLRAAHDAVTDCDLFLAVGTSLQVFPVAGLVDVAVSGGARVVIVNADPTPYDRVADAVLRDPIGVVLPMLVSRHLSHLD